MMGAELRALKALALCVACASVSACGGGDDDSKGNASGGAGQGGGGGSGATGGGGGSGPGMIPTCAASEARISVAGGMSYTLSYTVATNITSANMNSTKWAWGQNVGDYGLFKLVGSNALMGVPNQPAEGATLTVDHAIFAPNVRDTLGTMYGAAPGSGSVVKRENGQVVVDLQNVATMDGCGAFPVMGELNLCYNAGDDCPSSLERGTLDGYSWDDDVTSYSSSGGILRLSVGAQGANVRARLAEDGASLSWALFSTSLYGRYEGKTLCAGAGSKLGTMTVDGKSYTMLFLKNLSWLEGPGTGQISGCLG